MRRELLRLNKGVLFVLMGILDDTVVVDLMAKNPWDGLRYDMQRGVGWTEG